MTDLRELVDVGGPGGDAGFTCDAIVGGEVLAAVRSSRDEVLRRAAEAVEFEAGMAEIHAGTAAGLDRVDFPLGEAGRWARVWVDLTPVPQVVVWLA